MKYHILIRKIFNKWMKLRLRPISVYCLHHVCEQYDAESMYSCDWIALDDFKEKINVLCNQGYQFISLTDAYNHLNKDYFRLRKYAVLTFDDGYKSLMEVLPWLEKQRIPATLFINGKYLDGISFRENQKEQYLTYDELFTLTSPLIEIGNHGWEHIAATEMNEKLLKESLHKNIEVLCSHPRYIPFWAYTYGASTPQSDNILKNNQLVPVKVSGAKNNVYTGKIEREPLFYIDEYIKNVVLCRNIGVCKQCIYKFQQI